jgi:hypothetical protein
MQVLCQAVADLLCQPANAAAATLTDRSFAKPWLQEQLQACTTPLPLQSAGGGIAHPLSLALRLPPAITSL